MRTALLFLTVLPGLAAEPTLREQLENRAAESAKKADPEVARQYQEGIDQVAASGIYDRALKIGAKAPDFTLPDYLGKEVALSDLLAEGPVVLTWYRGAWCPYCNIALAALQRKLPEIRETGASLVALTPESPDHAKDAPESLDLEFSVLSDTGQKVADRYGLVFKMAPAVATAMREKAKTHVRNDDESDTLPLAATYVIDRDGTITWAFLDADYRRRAEPDRVVDALRALKDGPTPRHQLLIFWEQVWNPPYDLGYIDLALTEDFVLSNPSGDITGRDAFKDWVREFQGKIGGMRLEEKDTFESADGTRVTSRWLCTGSNRGVLGSEPDDRPIRFSGIAIWEIRDGLLAHNWVERSAWELHQALQKD